MAGKIKILPDTVAQTIAAGEVVERPASVVKELVENAIDARSTEIIVGLEAGGLQMIRVQDNGEGMEGEDVPVALQRYATSKIRAAEDLFNLHTLGFRGEALPSIGAVSLMSVKTRVNESPSGTRLTVDFGRRSGPARGWTKRDDDNGARPLSQRACSSQVSENSSNGNCICSPHR